MKSSDAGSVMVVAAHPDDEILGCGATIRKLATRGWQAHLVVMSGGISGRKAKGEAVSNAVKAQQAQLFEQTKRAAALVGFSSIEALDFPDNRMDTVGRMDIAQAVRPLIESRRPNLLLTHHPGDYNWDHSAVFDAVLMAARANPPDFHPDEIWLFEVRSSTERGWQMRQPFAPTIYVDIRDELAVKAQALSEYSSELRQHPHPRSIEGIRALAAARGHEVGMEAAESFEEVRRLIR